jgi:hypothetical protein
MCAGCASATSPIPAHADLDGEAEPTVMEADGVRFDAAGRRVDDAGHTTIAPPPTTTHTLSVREVAPARPRRVGPRDIQLHGARLDNALRMLAQEGRFNLVVRGDLALPISIDLKAVDPYEALLAIAQAHGIEVRYSDNIVIVGAE